MKQSKIIIAYKALETLSENEHLTKQNQWDIYKIRKFLRPHTEFQEEQEDALKEKYIKYTDEQGNLLADKVKDFMKELNEIGSLEKDLGEYDKPTIAMVDGISCKIIEPLEDFIEFTPE